MKLVVGKCLLFKIELKWISDWKLKRLLNRHPDLRERHRWKGGQGGGRDEDDKRGARDAIGVQNVGG